MDGVPLFLNERSYPIPGDQRNVLSAVTSMLQGLLRAKKLAGNIYLGSTEPLPSISLTATTYETIASVIKDDREWWRFLSSLEQRSPFGKVPQSIAPPSESHVDPSSTKGKEALLWAVRNESFVASFPSTKEWQGSKIDFRTCACGGNTHESAIQVSAKNIASADHADSWESELENFAFTPSASSEIYSGHNFSLRMFLNDHSPPHIHVYLGNYASGCAATVRFDVGPEVLNGKGLAGSTRSEVFDLLRARRDDLMTSWERCRSGQHPNRL